MAQVRKYANGNSVDKIKLFKHEGVGEYNIDDLTRAYASSIQDLVSGLDLNDKDRQKVLDYAGEMIRAIQDGTITERDINGRWKTTDESLASTGVNKKNFWGKYTKDDDFYKNVATDLVEKAFKNVPIYTPEAKKEEAKKAFDFNATKAINKYYFNSDKFDRDRWDYDNGKANVLKIMQQEYDRLKAGDFSNKDDYEARFQDFFNALNDDDPNNDIFATSRLGDFRQYLDRNYGIETKDAKETPAEEKKDDKAEEAIEKQRALAEIAYNEGNTSDDNLEIMFDPKTRKTLYGTMKNGVFFPTKGKPISLSATWNPSNRTYYSKNNLSSLLEMINSGYYNDKIPSFYESVKNLHGKEIPEDVKKWMDSYASKLEKEKEKEDKNTLRIRTNDFVFPYSADYSPYDGNLWNTIKKSLGRGFGWEPVFGIEKGSIWDKRLDITEKVGKWWNDTSDEILQLDKPAESYHRKKVRAEKEGGRIPKFQNPAGPIPHGVTAAKGTSWYNNYFTPTVDTLFKGLRDKKYTYQDVNNMQRNHAKIYSLAGNNFQNQAVRNSATGDYQKAFINFGGGFGNTLGITNAYNTGRYITGQNPISGDNPTKNFTVDNLYSTVTDDRRLLGRKGDYTPEQFVNLKNTALQNGFDVFLDTDDYYSLKPMDASSYMGNIREEEPGLQGKTKNEIIAELAQKPVELQEVVVTANKKSDTYNRSGAGIDPKKKNPTVRWDDVIGTGRMLGTIATNNAIARGVKNSLSPLLLDPLQIRRQVVGDLVSKNYMENLGAEANRIGSRPVTSDASLALGQALDYNNKAAEYRTKGFLADKQAYDKSSLEARQAAEQNAAARVDVANKNRASMLGIRQAKANIEAQRKSANWAQAIAPWLMDKEMKIAENRKLNNELDYLENQYLHGTTYENALNSAQKALENSKAAYLTKEGNTEAGWITSNEYKNAKNLYDDAARRASNIYRDNMLAARRASIKYNPFLFAYKSGGKLSYEEKSLLDRAKDFNKSLLSDRKLFHKIISDSQKENNKLIMSLSGLTKELIIKSMTL